MSSVMDIRLVVEIFNSYFPCGFDFFVFLQRKKKKGWVNY